MSVGNVLHSKKKYQNPEQKIKNEILWWLKSQPKCFVWPNDSVGIYDPIKRIFRKKNSPFHIKGVADILGIWNGMPIAIEVKSKKGVASPEQINFLKVFALYGGISLIARSVEDVSNHLKTIKVLYTSEPKPSID